MKIKQLKLHDFMSYEDTTLDISKVSVCSVVGPNGAGKSTIIEAIMWAIFGVARLPNKDLVRSGQTRAFVELIFDLDGHECTISRSFEDGETDVTFLVDGASVAEGKKNKGEEIARRLRASREILLSSIAVTQGQLSSFLQAPASERRDLIMSMLMLDKYEGAFQEAKKAFQVIVSTVATAKKTIETVENQIKQIPDPEQILANINEARIQEAAVGKQMEDVTTQREALLAQEKESRKRLDWLTMRSGEINEDSMKQASTFVREMTDLESTIKRVDDEVAMLPIYQKAVVALETEITSVQASIEEIAKMKMTKHQCDEQIKSLQDRILVASKAQDACPLCGGQLASQRWQEILSAMKMDLGQFVSNTSALGRTIQEKDSSTRSLILVQQELDTNRERITKVGARVESKSDLVVRLEQARVRRAEVAEKIKTELAAIEQEANTIRSGLSAEVVMFGQRLDALRAQRQKFSDSVLHWSAESRTRDNLMMMLKDTQTELALKKGLHDETEFIYNALAPNGIRLMIVDYYLPQIELRAKNLLHRMSDGRIDFKMSVVEVGQRKGIELMAGSGTLRPVRALSGGEQTRVSLAVRLALSQILSEMAGCKFDLLLLDEPEFLDEEGISQLVESISRLQDQFPQIIVMSHHPSLRQAFPNTITVEKNAGVSTAKVTS